MNTKFCAKCETLKSVDDFNKNPTKKDGLQSMCKICRKAYHEKHYQTNRNTYRNQNDLIRKRNGDFVKRYKSFQKCSKCTEKRWYVLDFHHINNDKDNEISNMIYECYSIKKIKEEIRKCVILCANCHRELHFIEKNWLEEVQ